MHSADKGSVKMKYTYFVSYAHNRGWGNIEITSSGLLDDIKVIHQTQNIIREISKMDEIVIIGFQLLKTENT